MRKVPCAIWTVKTLPHTDKEEKNFSGKLDIGMV